MRKCLFLCCATLAVGNKPLLSSLSFPNLRSVGPATGWYDPQGRALALSIGDNALLEHVSLPVLDAAQGCVQILDNPLLKTAGGGRGNETGVGIAVPLLGNVTAREILNHTYSHFHFTL